MNRKNITTLQQYFDNLSIIIEKLFENQRIKFLYKIGYDFYKFLTKTQYRIKYFCILLKKIIETTNNKSLLKYLQKFNENLEKNIDKNKYCIDFFNETYIKKYVSIILWYHFSSLLEFLEDSIRFNFKEIEEDLISITFEKAYEYRGIIDSIKREKYGRILDADKMEKEKAITRRLKKKNAKFRGCKKL